MGIPGLNTKERGKYRDCIEVAENGELNVNAAGVKVKGTK
jgi:hypothetical protein